MLQDEEMMNRIPNSIKVVGNVGEEKSWEYTTILNSALNSVLNAFKWHGALAPCEVEWL